MFGKRKEIGSIQKHDKTSVTNVVREALESIGFKYDYKCEINTFMTSFMGDDLPISLNIIVNDTTISFLSMLYLKTSEERYKDVAWELNQINKTLIFGAFYLDSDNGMIMFEYNFPYIETNISPGYVLAFMKMLGETVDEHDGNLKKLAESVPRSDSSFNRMYG